MPLMATGVLPPVGSRFTEEITFTTVSFCMSSRKNWSMVHSKNSHSPPMVMEKQKATMAMYTGERDRETRLWRLHISTREKPMAAHRKPLMVCSMVSQ